MARNTKRVAVAKKRSAKPKATPKRIVRKKADYPLDLTRGVIIYLREHTGYTPVLSLANGRPALNFGCRHFASRQSAERHYGIEGNSRKTPKSVSSGTERPKMREIFDTVERLCKRMGFKW